MAIIFNFEDMQAKGDKTLKALIASFKKQGVFLIASSVHISAMKRSSGISYKELTLTTSDSQQVQFWIKSSGDIFKVKVSSLAGRADALKEMPIKNQQDHDLAIKEIADRLIKDRKPFQAKLTKLAENEVAKELKDKMKVTNRKIEQVLQEEIQQIDEALAEADKRLAELQG